MTKTQLAAMLGVAGILSFAGIAGAQVAGSSTTVGISVTEQTEVVDGWSVRKSILGKSIYNDAGDRIGKVDDLIITREKHISYAIVGVGGFIGIGEHDVAVPMSQIRELGGKIVLAGATKDVIKALPEFHYATATTDRERFLADADKDIAKAKEKIAEFEKQAAAAKDDVKARLEKQNAALHKDLEAAEDKLTEMKRAAESKWKKFEANVSRALAHLKQSLEKSNG